jgi:hypothetical protein
MASSGTEYYRGRAKDCCHRAIIAEDIDQRTHWLEAAARWVSLARQEGFLLPTQKKALPSNDPAYSRALSFAQSSDLSEKIGEKRAFGGGHAAPRIT